jgi:hypothetical protein
MSPVAGSENSFEVVVLHLTGDLPAPFLANYPEFPDSCLPAQFSLVEDVHQVFVYRPHILLEQLRNQSLRQPQRLVFQPTLDACPPVLGLVEDKFGTRGGQVAHGNTLHAKQTCK